MHLKKKKKNSSYLYKKDTIMNSED